MQKEKNTRRTPAMPQQSTLKDFLPDGLNRKMPKPALRLCVAKGRRLVASRNAHHRFPLRRK
ncbi:MAG TPA: hypothetical protein PLU16_13885 [Gallionellaceae bacterium]|nr:hypothetical protein [Gallionellaceae bacterium]HQS76300.1 hypothetical protein [Gallionellaceae bacterium]